MNVPLAEHFHSIQGEGLFAGSPMHFLRLPGCCVGRARDSAPALLQHQGPSLPPVLSDVPAKLCTSAFGSEFWCDTDYSKHTEVPVEDLLEETYERHVCWTGGEPLMHQAREWMIALNSLFRLRGIQQHVETSGTVPFRMAFDWITVSPKESWRQDVVREADQIKFLVDEQFSLERADEITQLAPERCLVYLSPIFDPNLPVPGNVKLALAYLTQRPQWRLNIQWHKFLGLR